MKAYVLGIILIIDILFLSGMGNREFHWYYIPLDILAFAYLALLVIANRRRT